MAHWHYQKLFWGGKSNGRTAGSLLHRNVEDDNFDRIRL